eukprot:PITA_14913
MLMEGQESCSDGARLGQEFWAEAVDTACYLVNRSPSSALEDKTHKKYGLEEESDSVAEEESEDEEPQTMAVRRSVLERRQPERFSPSAFYSNFSLSVTDDDPITVKEAVDSEDGKLWKEAMVYEMAFLHKNKAWDLVEFLARKKPIGNKWVFKKKTNAEGKVEKYKAWLVEKGYSHVQGIDFGDIFSPVAKVTSIRLLLSIAATFDFEVEQMDVKTAFLHGDLEEEIYMKQPEGFAVKVRKN